MSGSEYDLEELSGIGRERANDLRAAGYETLTAVGRASAEDLAGVPGISRELAEELKAEVGAVDGRGPDAVRSRATPVQTDVDPAGVDGFEHVREENRDLLNLAVRRSRLRRLDPEALTPILLPPVVVDVLVVADTAITHDEQDFGLQAFAETLLQPPGPYVRFRLTLAHRGNGNTSQSLRTAAGVDRVIDDFRFDDADHFDAGDYDQVWLFGFSGRTSGSAVPSESELRVLSEFMDGGGGVFATGDHGALGRALSSEVPRVRSMRLWDNSSGEVAMADERRNDTNRTGRNATDEFDDESDDVPQRVDPKSYRHWEGIWEVSHPHPILCGPDGPIDVMPDHPHEGECIEPADVTEGFAFDGYSADEYPTDGSGNRPTPEIISTSTVDAGNTAGMKTPTEAQEFGGICAYDGHRAGVGRVVTDATWHHFLNNNVVGQSFNPDPVKEKGFLYSQSGQDHLDDIRTYFRNLAVWLSREGQIHRMNHRTVWDLLWHHRVVEAVSTRGDVTFEGADARYLFDVGRHARDVLGNHASECQSRRLAIDLLRPHVPEELLDGLDPWRGDLDRDELPWTSAEPVLDVALGGALVALREAFPEADPEARDEAVEALPELVESGVLRGLELARADAEGAIERFTVAWEGSGDDLDPVR